ncbi:hypothetical protein F7734_02625 [Scytonema sp. UIC 10036]|uniref:hypothetical protein n=1 Tax=Scytonema sp. UIC 10036 TaxID=2304196 RepID=UPI0012DA041C|nr:hypothetical protein [Scytonema sp. UIC 10036]MUG91439.1 hypothetical protein [Scytonema sp. UIC 10036]
MRDKVLILCPAYVAGKIGVIVDREMLSRAKFSGRWLIQVNSENIVVSLTPKEFEVVNDENEIF